MSELSSKNECNGEKMSIGSRLRQIRLRKKLTIAELSSLVNIPERTISNYEREERKPSIEYVSLLKEHLSIDSNWVLSGDGEMLLNNTGVSVRLGNDPNVLDKIDSRRYSEYSKIALYDIEASAETGAFNNNESIETHILFRTDWIKAKLMSNPDDLFVVRVAGDSMQPAMNTGDILLCDKGRDAKKDGIYIIRIDDQIFVKNLQYLPGYVLKLWSNNSIYSPIEISAKENTNTKIIARVVWLGKTLV